MQRLIIEGELKQINDDIIKQAFVKLIESKQNRNIEGKNYTLKITVNKVNKKAVINLK